MQVQEKLKEHGITVV